LIRWSDDGAIVLAARPIASFYGRFTAAASSRSGLRLVHRRLRYARSERG